MQDVSVTVGKLQPRTRKREGMIWRVKEKSWLNNHHIFLHLDPRLPAHNIIRQLLYLPMVVLSHVTEPKRKWLSYFYSHHLLSCCCRKTGNLPKKTKQQSSYGGNYNKKISLTDRVSGTHRITSDQQIEHCQMHFHFWNEMKWNATKRNISFM